MEIQNSVFRERATPPQKKTLTLSFSIIFRRVKKEQNWRDSQKVGGWKILKLFSPSARKKIFFYFFQKKKNYLPFKKRKLLLLSHDWKTEQGMITDIFYFHWISLIWFNWVLLTFKWYFRALDVRYDWNATHSVLVQKTDLIVRCSALQCLKYSPGKMGYFSFSKSAATSLSI